jgi:2-phospho-L-lactate guanylyltransferase (CobY/MobA/RfbA family)
VSAKQRLAELLPAEVRQNLALAMLEDVLQALTAVRELAGVVVATVDAAAADVALRFGAQVLNKGVRNGHTGAVTAAARRLADESATMLTLPGDIPQVSRSDLEHLLTIHPRRQDSVSSRQAMNAVRTQSFVRQLISCRYGSARIAFSSPCSRASARTKSKHSLPFANCSGGR